MCRIAAMCYLSHTSFPFSLSPTEGVNFALKPDLFSYQPPPPTETLNFILGPHLNWLVMSGHPSAGKLPSKSGCRL